MIKKKKFFLVKVYVDDSGGVDVDLVSESTVRQAVLKRATECMERLCIER